MNSAPATELFTLVIRSSGERSASACRRLLKDEFPEIEPEEIQGLGFREALQKTLLAGIQGERPWLLVVDADLLIARGTIDRLIQHASAAPKSMVFCLSWQLDKLFTGFRKGGLKLYRTSLLGYALEALNAVPTDALRPESDMIQRLSNEGFSYEDNTGIVACLHDYEQYYRDVYRKAFLHARKHREFMHLLMPVWEKLQEVDGDYRVALCGARDGLLHKGSVSINVSSNPDRFDEVLANLGLKEKEANGLSHLTPDSIGTFIGCWTPPLGTASLMRRAGVGGGDSKWDRLCELGQSMGWPGALTWAVGSRLKAAGVGLMTWTERRAEKQFLRSSAPDR
jgi:hypothetical protein